jgi:DNA-binding response OmpR family regulator
MANTPKQILIVDDDEDFCKLTAQAFKEEGFSVYSALDGDAALNLFKENHMPIVLLDVAMPGRNGFEVAAEIRKLEPENTHTFIVVMTAHTRSFFISKEFDVNIDSYVTKMTTPYEIVNHIVRLIG